MKLTIMKNIGEKFIPLGSPKFDKIFNTTREDYYLPKEWEQKIQNKKSLEGRLN